MKKRTIEIIFVGIDDWYRPVFKQKEKEIYFGDTDHLWTYGELGEDNINILRHYKKDSGGLCYFGGIFNCEPNGGRSEKWDFVIIENEKKENETNI